MGYCDLTGLHIIWDIFTGITDFYPLFVRYFAVCKCQYMIFYDNGNINITSSSMVVLIGMVNIV